MGDFEEAFGDRRRSAALARLENAMVAQSTLVVRRLGGDRAGEVSAHRVLSAEAVTPAGIVGCLALGTAQASAGRRVVVAQDTTEVNYPGHSGKAGRAGRLGKTPGFFLHGAIAIDVEQEAVLGVVDARIWYREDEAITDRRQRSLAQKESVRWLETARQASERLSGAGAITVVGDAESDIFALFARRPGNCDLVVRVGQNRAVANGGYLYEQAAGFAVLGCQLVQVAPHGRGDAGRVAKVELRGGTVVLRHPNNGRREGPAELAMTLVEAIEVAPPAGVTPLHWRLLSSLAVPDLAAAIEIVRLYRLRWRIEQAFRMLKSDGLKLDEVLTCDTHRLFNLAALGFGAAVRIVQLVDARDGGPRPASDAADDAQIAAAIALGAKLEGKTVRQRNPHPQLSLAWLSWIIARLGGWNCYYKPPGPKTMRQGWDRFAAMAEGFQLARAPAR
jgi:hypothetical protein